MGHGIVQKKAEASLLIFSSPPSSMKAQFNNYDQIPFVDVECGKVSVLTMRYLQFWQCAIFSFGNALS